MRIHWAVAALLVGCGSGEDLGVPGNQGSSTQALTCGTEARDNGDGTATMVGCSWEQQQANILSHGLKLAAPRVLDSAGAAAGIEVTHQCGDWLLGADPSGLVVFVSAQDGEVRSHGSMHPGFASSELPATLALPLTLEQ